MEKTESRGLVTLAVMAATLMQTLDTTIANVALPHMQGSLSASQDQITWVLTSYIVAAAIATAPTGFLEARLGRKQLFVGTVIGFTIASVLCGAAQTLTEMVTFRVMQGICGAALVPLSQTVLLDTYPPEQHSRAMAMWGMGVMLGPIIGPTLGGWLTEHHNWRWVFYINLPIGVIAAMTLAAALPTTRSARRASLDGVGFALLSIAIGAMQLFLDRGESVDWFGSREIMIEATIAGLALYLFVVHNLTAKNPFLPPRLFRDRSFAAGLVMIGIIGVVLFATSALMPPFLQHLKGYPVVLVGIVSAPRGIGTMIAMMVTGRLLRRVDPRLVIFVGSVFMFISLQWMARFNLNVPIHEIVWSSVLQGLGLGLVFVSLTTLAFGTLAQGDRAYATSLFSLMRNAGSSVGIALCFAMLSQNTQAGHALLAEHVNPFNPAVAQYVSANGGLIKAGTLATVEAEVTRQAAMLAYLADFRWMSWLTLLPLPLLLLFPGRPRAVTEADEESALAAVD